MSNIFEKGDFLSLFGVQRVWSHLDKSDVSDHSTVSTDISNGTIRVLLLRAKKTSGNGFKISLKYLHHQNASRNEAVNFLSLSGREKDGQIIIEKAKAMDEALDVSDNETILALENAFNNFTHNIINNNEWVNPVKFLKDVGLSNSGVGQKSWPGLYVTGDFKSATSSQSIPFQESVFPALFLHSVIGAGPDQYADNTQNSHSCALHSGTGDDRKNSLLKYSYQRGKKRGHLDLSGKITISTPEGQQMADFYKIQTRPLKRDKSQAKITALEYMGHQIDVSDPRAVSSVLKTIRNINRTIRAGSKALIEDLKKEPHERRLALPTELMLHLGVYPLLNKETKIPAKGLMTFTARGGNNSTPYTSDVETNIGANQYNIGYEYPDENGEEQQENIMIDSGVLFHDVFNEGFINPAPYLYHKSDKSHVPEHPVSAIMYTHRHKDHLGALANIIKSGYQIPPLIMNEMSMLQLKREMSELNIERTIKDEILAQCYPVNLSKDVNPSDPEKRKTTTINGTTIEQWTEVLPGDRLGQTHCYPILQIGKITIRVGPMPHSDPGLMFNLSTPAGSHVHTGDYKLSDDEMLGAPPLRPWLEATNADSLSADSTGATKDGKNPSEKDVEEGILQEMLNSPDKNQIHVMLGSNIARLETDVRAAGRAGKKGIILDGAAVENLARDADQAHDLKTWAMRKYGMEILFRDNKKAKDNLYNPDYVKIITGTQDEEFSTVNRLLRDWLPPDRLSIQKGDRIVFLQGAIPVGDNAKKRYAMIEPTKNFHEADIILPEIVEKEAGIILHSSGHNNREDMGNMIRMLKNPHVIPVHGGPHQLQAHAEIAEEVGANSTIAPGSITLRTAKGKKVSPLRIEQPEMVGVTLHTPSDEKFFLKGRFSTCVLPIKPALDGQEIQLIEEFETIARQLSGTASKYEMAETQPISLSRTFNAQNANNYLSQNMPFGIDKYKGSVFEDKNIFAIGAFDTETGGTDASQFLIREFGLHVEDLDENTIKDTQLYQKIPSYRMPSPEALLVTNTSPETLEDGLDNMEFVDEMNKAIKDLKEHSYEQAIKDQPDAEHTRNSVKALAIAHNAKFDARFIAKEQARNLFGDVRPQATRGVIQIDTRNISRAIAAFMPQKYNVNINPTTNFADHSLEGLCDANQVSYDTSQSHGALYDTLPCMGLFKKQREIAPDIVEQMIINAESSKSHLLNDMMGMDTGYGGPHPVFSYVSPNATKPKAQMGCFVGTMDSERYGVVFNLKYDPNDYMHLPTSTIIEMLQDSKDDVFEVINLREQPIVMPARYGLRISAAGNTPKETLDFRAGVVRRNLNYIDPQNNWQNIAQKLDAAWKSNKSAIFQKRIIKDYPDLKKAMLKYDKAPTPEDGAIKFLGIVHNKMSPVNKKLREAIKLYRTALIEKNYEEASEHFQILLEDKKDLGNVMDTINNIHYDIAPQDMPPEELKRTEHMRAYMAYIGYHEACESLERLEKPEAYARYIGNDKGKKALLKNITQWVEDHEHFGTLSDEVKEFVRPWTKHTKASNEHKPTSPEL